MRYVLALCLLLMLPANAYAQGGALLDATVRVVPGITEGQCVWIEAGTVTVTARQVGANQWPVTFNLLPDTGPASTMLTLGVNSTEPQSVSQRVDTGWRCYRLHHVQETRIDPVLWPRWEQAIELRLSWAP
jgi:hypothetical protein